MLRFRYQNQGEVQRVRNVCVAPHSHEAGRSRPGSDASFYGRRAGGLDDQGGSQPGQSGCALRGMGAMGVKQRAIRTGFHFNTGSSQLHDPTSTKQSDPLSKSGSWSGRHSGQSQAILPGIQLTPRIQHHRANRYT